MKRIVIACDGTWRRLDARHPTNVAKLARAVLPIGPDGVEQVVCHLDGVGSGRGTGAVSRTLDRMLGGLFGMGLMDAIEEAYRFLALNYAPGDEIHVFGYSRGAFTARSLVGLIRNCGIPERAHANAVPEALALYRARGGANRPDGREALKFRAKVAGHVVTSVGEARWRSARSGGEAPAAARLAIAYLGVWETVGALGMPRHLRLAKFFNRGLGFHDTRLSGIVRAARHAVAIDERRRSFQPTLWDNLAELNAGGGRAYRQAWFPGDHGSVGGGGPVTTLSDDALAWVAEGAAAAGLALDPAACAAWLRNRNWSGPLAASGKPSAIGWLLALDQKPRRGPEAVAELADATVRRWNGDPGSRPPTLRRVAAWLDAGRAGDGRLPDAPPLGA
jgi:uncharacterized protein (DUF2235 family)